MKGWYKALEDLVWLTQLGLNMLLPLVMCLGGAWWAVNNWSWPEWVFLPAILLGLAAGAQNFWYFAKDTWTAPKRKNQSGWGSTRISKLNRRFPFMKLQPESKKELTRIACGTAICTAVMWVIFAALHLVGWVKFDYTVVLGSLIGAAVAIGNFAGICLVCQKVIDEQDEKRRKATLQASYNVRMLLQAVWIIVAIGAPVFQPFAGVLPLLFPRVTIYYLQITGKYKPLAPAGPSVDVSVEDDPEPAPEPEAEPRDEGGET